MKSFEGSPAPWRINGIDYHDYGLIDAEGGEIMLLKADCEQDDHNATLIAAAPDLLNELQKLREYVINVCDVDEEDCHIEHPLMSSRAAISKALGEE
ncbi:hypothetical protein [Enterobacter asburiae]|uniref:hypothetical protein n=1 Tax=Enterobacter asburiae TaxID=61645 RepID=UPI0021D15A73|nr:hypothetical protein [Enterobacter asburiae]MCU6241169.1 hypothetical protein [Enterobacter asburiae]